MSHKTLKSIKNRKKRALRIRKKIRGSAQKPRLSVMKTLKHIGAQVIDDENGVTIVGVSTQSKSMNDCKKNIKGAQSIGQMIAELAKKKNIEHVVFDRGRFKYHGLVAELANAARENGLKF